MDTIAWLFIMAAGLMIRQASKGRAGNLPEDIRDFTVAALSNDVKSVKEVMARTGEGTTADKVSLDTVEYATGSGDLISEMKRLAAAAGYNYHWGGTTISTGFDCSGLIWAALKSLGYYNGPRFTTKTFPGVAKEFSTPVPPSQATTGDIVIWPNSHMGVVTGSDRYFSALSERSGIKEDAIHNHKGTPSYYRPRKS